MVGLFSPDPQFFSGMCQDSHWFEEYLKIIEIDDHFSNERSFFVFFTPLTYLDHIPSRLFLFGQSRYKDTAKIRPMAYPVLEIFFCRWAFTLPPRFDKEATSALWLTSLGAPPDCRNRPDLAGHGVRQVGSSGGHNR